MITTTQNKQTKQIIKLKKSARERRKQELFLVEGIRMFRETPKRLLKEVYASESFYKKEKHMTDEALKGSGAHLLILSDTVFGYVSDTKTPQGILCVVEQMNHEINELTSAKCPLIMVLDHLQDPGNLGTILRTAEGAGVTGILMDRECVDVYNPKTIRSTMGSIYRMPFVYVEDLGKGIQDLKDKGITTYAAHLEGTNSYDEEDLTNPCAFLIGNEGNGLRREIADMADCYVKIPMLGQVESLNAAIASSVLMFEAARQRRKV